MENNPLVSVIIPVRNGERFLASAINSLLEQDYKHYELLVVDGKSTDNTEKIARSFQKVRYILQGDEGFGNALNTGIDFAQGELIAFMACDDLWASDKLSLQVQYLVHHSDIQYSITRVKFFLEEGDSVPPGFRKELLTGDHAGYMPEALVVRKSLFEQIGNFNADLKLSADVDWFARAKDWGVPIAIIPKVLLYKRVHNSNSSLISSQARAIDHEILKSIKHSIDRQRTGTFPKKRNR